MRGADGDLLGRAQKRIDAAVAGQEAQDQHERTDHGERELREVGIDAGRHFDAHGGEHALPAQARMMEHAGDHVAIDRIEDEHDVEDEQRHVPLARVFHDQGGHDGTDEEVGGVPHPGTRGAERLVFGVHVVGDGQRAGAIDRRDGVIREGRQTRIEIAVAQRLQGEEDEGDGDERQRQQRRSADARTVIVEDIKKKRDRHGIIDAIDDDPRPDGRGICHGGPMLLRELARAGALRPPLVLSLGSGPTWSRSWNPTSCPTRPCLACIWRGPDEWGRTPMSPRARASGRPPCCRRRSA